jgi:hypothetical protein
MRVEYTLRPFLVLAPVRQSLQFAQNKIPTMQLSMQCNGEDKIEQREEWNEEYRYTVLPASGSQ